MKLNWIDQTNIDQKDDSPSTVYSLQPNRSRIIVDSSGYRFLPEIQERLEHLLQLEVGWDGYNGEPISFPNAYFAIRVIESVCTNDIPPPQIVPGTGGDLQIEWHSDTVEIELHIIAPNKVEAWICNAETGNEGEELFLTNNFIAIAKSLSEMRMQNFDNVAPA